MRLNVCSRKTLKTKRASKTSILSSKLATKSLKKLVAQYQLWSLSSRKSALLIKKWLTSSREMPRKALKQHRKKLQL
jgi:hypothetical protein